MVEEGAAVDDIETEVEVVVTVDEGEVLVAVRVTEIVEVTPFTTVVVVVTDASSSSSSSSSSD